MPRGAAPRPKGLDRHASGLRAGRAHALAPGSHPHDRLGLPPTRGRAGVSSSGPSRALPFETRTENHTGIWRLERRLGRRWRSGFLTRESSRARPRPVWRISPPSSEVRREIRAAEVPSGAARRRASSALKPARLTGGSPPPVDADDRPLRVSLIHQRPSEWAWPDPASRRAHTPNAPAARTRPGRDGLKCTHVRGGANLPPYRRSHVTLECLAPDRWVVARLTGARLRGDWRRP